MEKQSPLSTLQWLTPNDLTHHFSSRSNVRVSPAGGRSDHRTYDAHRDLVVRWLWGSQIPPLIGRPLRRWTQTLGDQSKTRSRRVRWKMAQNWKQKLRIAQRVMLCTNPSILEGQQSTTDSTRLPSNSLLLGRVVEDHLVMLFSYRGKHQENIEWNMNDSAHVNVHG